MSEPTLTAALLIKNLAVILASAIGSLVSLRFIKHGDDKKGASLLLDNLMLILGGFGFSMFVAPAAHEYLSLTDKALPAVHFMFGLFGLSVAYQVNERVSPIVDFWLKKFNIKGGDHV